MASSPRSRSVRRRPLPRPGTLLLLALAYLPALATAPGVVAADTKQYLFLDPGSFLTRARVLWDTSQFGGYVTHQQVGLLWPMGPWFYLTHAVGLPVWVAQRLWVGTLIALAALGARHLAGRLGLPPHAALVVGLAYGFSPYLLTYVSRTSVLLLPWAALGWAMVLTIDALARGGWRAPAALGLVVTTVGSVNATAVALVGLGPIVLAVDAIVSRAVPARHAAAAAARVALCTSATSLWWIVALVVEGRFGAAVLRYSETISAVATTSSSTEVARGLGYWLFYGTTVDGAWNSAAPPYLTNPLLIALTMLLATAGVAGLTLVPWRARRALVWQLAIGTVVAVGAHAPRSPYGALLGGRFARSTLALALRSSTRAVPLVVLALACGLGAAVAVCSARVPRLDRPIAAGVGVLTLLQLPALVSGGYVDALLRRPAELPAWWKDAAAELTRRGGQRLLELPGQEFAAYRWGTTTDPILPGITGRALITRDLLPLGADQRMNLLYALDQRFQDRIVEPRSVAPVARLLGATDIVARLDADWERYRTPAPGDVWRALDGAAGLAQPALYGPPVAADRAHPVDDAMPATLAAPGAVAVFAVDGTPEPARTEPVAGATIVAGDGDGIVDAAASGLVDGLSPIVYAADLSEAGDRADGGIDHAILAGARTLVVTDTNRSAARQWRGTQDVAGFTEDAVSGSGARDEADARLAPFGPEPDPSTFTVARQRGPWSATASAYGEPNAFRPEDRAVNAIDASPSTAWRVADRADPVGAALRLRATGPTPIDGVRLLQPQRTSNRHITTVTITTDHERRSVPLDESSKTPPGQFIPLDGSPTSAIAIRIDATDVPAPPSFFGLDAVGFADVVVSSPGTGFMAPTVERVVLPTQLDPATEAGTADVAIVLTRQRVDPTDRWRNDPEPSLSREIRLPPGGAAAAITARLDRRAPDYALAPLLGLARPPTASSTLAGVLEARPWAATDGDTSTAWTSAVDDAVGAWWETPLAGGATVEHIRFRVVDDDRHSVPRAVRITIGATSDDVVLPAAAPSGVVDVALPAPRRGDRLRVTVLDAVGRTMVDRRYGETVQLPIAFAEIAAPGIEPAAAAATSDRDCRVDLLAIDGRPVPVRVTVAGDAAHSVTVDVCDADAVRAALAAGPDHVVTSGDGASLGIDIDRVVLSVRRSSNATARPGATALARPRRGTATEYRLSVPASPDDRWLVVPDAVNAGWTATLAGATLGPSRPINGGAAAWPLPAGPGGVVRVRWAPQRWADAALVASAVAIVCSVSGLAFGAVRRRRLRPARVPDDWCSAPRLGRRRADAHTTSRRATATAALAAGLVVSTFVDPAYGAGAALLVGITWGRPGRLALRLAAPSAVLTGGLYVVARQLVSQPVAGFGWPLAGNAVHRPVLAGIVLAAVAVAADGEGTRRATGRD